MRVKVVIDLSQADLVAFEAYEMLVLPLIANHGGTLETRSRTGACETHRLNFPAHAAFEAFLADPARRAAQPIGQSRGARAATTIEPGA